MRAYLSFFLFFLFFSFIPITEAAHVERPATKALLQLEDIDFSQDDVIELNGEWEFYWNQLLEPSELKAIQNDGKTYFTVPQIWSGQQLGNTRISPEGYATYRLFIKLKDSEKNTLKALYMPSVATSYKLWVDGKLQAANGLVGTHPSEMLPKNDPKVIAFQPTKNQIEIVLQVANFVQRKGGLWQPLLFGDAASILKTRESNIAFQMFLVGSLSIIGLYHIGLFFNQRIFKSSLFFGIFCLLISIRTLVTGDSLLVHFAPFFSWELAVKIEYWTAMAGIPILVLYVYEMFPQEMSKKFVKFSVIVGLSFSLLVLVTPAKVYTHTMLYHQILILITLIYILYVYMLALFKGQTGSLINLAAISALFLTAVNDVLFYNHIISTSPMISLGLFIFLFSQMVILSRKFTQSFTQVKLLSEKLVSINETLEDEVDKRTAELLKANKHLEQTNTKLVKVERSRSKLLSNISHDLGTPMTSIQGYIKAMLDGVIQTGDPSYLNLIYKKIVLMNRLILDLLDLSKLEEGSFHFIFEQIILPDFVQELFNKYKADMEQHGIHAIYRETSNCPSNHEVYAKIDPIRIEQVFSNLISNAKKYSSQNGTISCETEIQMDYDAPVQEDQSLSGKAIIRIKDNGKGISPASLPHIFTRYYREFDSGEKKDEGSGLGLAISKEIVEAHGGVIFVDSQVGEGSTFCFTLPVSVKPR